MNLPFLARRLPVPLHLLALASLGCGASSPASTGPGQTLELPAPAVAPPIARHVSNDPCHGRAGCEIEARHEAGTSAAGHRMLVVEVSLGMRDEEGAEPTGARNCEEREAWLVHLDSRSGGPSAPPPLALLTMCNDGYGASGVGEDELRIEPNRLVHTRMGGSAWRWSTTTTAQLDPPAVLAESRGSWWALSQNHDSESQFDFRTFQGFERIESPICDSGGEMPELGETEIEGLGSQPIPALALPEALSRGPIAEAAAVDLAPCAVRGALPGDPGDAGYAAVLDTSTGTLLVQVRDDAWTSQDRLLIWAAPEARGGGVHCHVPRRVTPIEVGVDGRTVAAGTQWGANVAVGTSPDGTRRLWRLPVGAPSSLTVGYRDGDPGQPNEGLATSDAAATGDLLTLGSVRRLEPSRVTCQLVGAELRPRLADPPTADGALLGDGW